MDISKDEAKQRLTELIEKHQRHKNEGRFAKINEENTKDYIDELFRILGWDFTEDVIKEYGTGERRRIDYAFHLDGTVKFLVEAKQYNEDLDPWVKKVLEYGYQNDKTAWVILTNFKEIRIYNAKYYDKEEHIRRLYEPIHIEDAVIRLDDLWILSRQGIKENLINQVAQKYGKIKPKKPIDALIYEDLMEWRKRIQGAILSHPRLNKPDDPEEAENWLSEAVQKVLNRIIFVRVCEDRGLEAEGMLKWHVDQWKKDKKTSLLRSINRQFSKMNSTYNSGLFAEHYSEELKIDDTVLAQIIEETYVSPEGLNYDFSAIDADILGAMYENYLAYIQGRVREREKKQKSKRKSQGIYYTPAYIVDYIVKNTLGEKLKECKTPEEALKIRVLDPACGSGSFLIRAYDGFKRWYAGHQKKNGGEQTKLDFDNAKYVQTFMDQVLEKCLYGVDVDEQAVEIAQLNLLLKAAEQKHKLPMLNHTIQCGNSLIDDPAVAGDKAFKWEERFPEVFRNGGFDVVVGNPPWVRAKVSCTKNDIDFLRKKYGSYSIGELNLYKLFMIRSLQLIKIRGHFSFIVPNSYLSDRDSTELRKWILNEFAISQLVIFSERATKDMFEITQATTIIVVENQRPNKQTKLEISQVLEETEAFKLKQLKLIKIPQFEFLNSPDYQIFSGCSQDELKLIEKLLTYSKLGNHITTNDGEIHLTKYSDFINNGETNDSALLIRGNHLIRYFVDLRRKNREGGWIKLGKLKVTNDMCKKRRILVQQVSNMAQKYRIKGAIIEPSIYAGNSCVSVISNDPVYSLEYILSLLNSRLLNWYFKFFSSTNHVTGRELQNLPFVRSDRFIKNLENLVTKIIFSNKRLSELSDQNSNEVQHLKAEIEKTDAEIDRLVYELYGLTEDEIKIVEERLK